MYCTCIQSNLSIPDTLGPSKTVLIIEVSLLQRFIYTHLYCSGTTVNCPYFKGVLISAGVSTRAGLTVIRLEGLVPRAHVARFHCTCYLDLYKYNFLYVINFRSKDFRPSFGQLTEIRTIVLSGTPYMACTATASRSVRIEKLETMGCVHISASPDRPNIFYGVRVRTDIEKDFHELTLSLKNNLINTPRVIVYCQSLTMCSDFMLTSMMC